MGVQLAPYNNAMRLGQGFNSYTQQICLNDAVMQPSKAPRDAKDGKSGQTERLKIEGSSDSTQPLSEIGSDGGTKKIDQDVPNKGVSQIVSYSSRFVDKLSDLTDAMNISASLSIKTASIGGSASGSFVDSDKFKESDMNFFVQVKVVNQIIVGEDYTEFQNILPPGARFTEVYGDTFISGFELGGELNALISVKVSDKSKTFAIKAELEATLGTPALSGKVSGGVDMNKSEMKSSTETTVTVNWSGGGQIKPTDAIWDVNSLTLAAANFPDHVARTPQRTYAILSKYTSLKSFLSIYQPSSVLAYENAGVYTSHLLDIYMDYKSIWKQIQIASFELKNRRADIRPAKVSKEVKELAEAHKSPADAKAKTLEPIKLDSNQGIATPAEKSTTVAVTQGTNPPQTPVPTNTSSQGQDTQNSPKSVTIPNLIDYTPYTATVLGLDKARRACRNEMIKIVTEVDLVTTYPHYALDPTREDRFVSPRVFTQLLPVVTLRPVETDNPDSNLNPKNLVILGETDEAPRLQQWLYNRAGSESAREPYPKMSQSLDFHKTKSKKFDMGDAWAGVEDPGKSAIWFNCLDKIEGSWMPKAVSIWTKDEILVGLKVVYTNGEETPYGDCSGEPQKSLEIQDGQAESVAQLIIETAEPLNSTARVRSLRMTLDSYKRQEYPQLDRAISTHTNVAKVTLDQPTNGLWSFRGFWGSVTPFQGGFLALGAVWGLDEAKSQQKAIQPSAAGEATGPDYQMFMGRPLPEDALKSAIQYKAKAGKYSMSSFLGDSNVDKENTTYFNDMELIKDDKWKIGSITFYCDERYRLSGYITRYIGGDPIRRGKCPSGAAGEKMDSKAQHWTQVRLDSSWLDDKKYKVLTSVELTNNRGEEPLIFQAPGTRTLEITQLSRPDSTWSLAGFWGYHHKGIQAFTQFGVIWAKRDELNA